MGQPHLGQYGDTPAGGSPHPAPPGPPQFEPPRQVRSRAGLWLALGCAVMVIVLLFVAVTGGVAYLVTRGGSQDPEDTAPSVQVHTEETFFVEYPTDWFESEVSAEEAEAGMLLEVMDAQIDEDDYDEFAPNSMAVYLFDSGLHAKVECQNQAIWLGFGWDDAEDAVELDPTDIGGKQLAAQRATGTHDGQDVVAETYCADVGDQVMQIVVESHGSTELSPQVQRILGSWSWTPTG